MSKIRRDAGEIQTREAVTITEMAAMVELSRSRFHQLVKSGVFPPPVYDPRTRRPYYTPGQQRAILDVRDSNCGVDGKPVLFYSTRSKAAAPKPKLGRVPISESLIQVVGGVRSLGLQPSRKQVDAVLRQLYPGGVSGVAMVELVKTVFLELKRQATTDLADT
jgi:hypothetical protein